MTSHQRWACYAGARSAYTPSREGKGLKTPHPQSPEVDEVMNRNTATRDRHRKAIARGKPPCAICGQPIQYDLPHLDPMAYVVDHIVPLAKGGADELANKQPAHRSCNRDKSDRDHGRIIRQVAGVQW